MVQFKEEALKEVNGSIHNKHWGLVPIFQVLKKQYVPPSVWLISSKRDIRTGKIFKHKPRLNIHRRNKSYTFKSFNTFTLVSNWNTTYLLLVSILRKWHTIKVEFLMHFSQAPIKNLHVHVTTPCHREMVGKGRVAKTY